MHSGFGAKNFESTFLHIFYWKNLFQEYLLKLLEKNLCEELFAKTKL